MGVDFGEVIDRSGKDSIAWDVAGAIAGGSLGPTDAQVEAGFDAIPMWVADMNFATAPSVTRALRERVEHPCYGYFEPSAAYFDCIARWHERRQGVCGMAPEHIGYENGVLGGVATALSVLCSRGDAVLVHSPTYTGFTKVLGDCGYRMVASPLVRDGCGVWRMDYADMEEKIAREHIHAAIVCSPHNPSGRVWEREELERAMALFQAYDVRVISDEIWSDIVLGGHVHIPTQSVSADARRRTVALYAPSKTFNLAGLVGSYHVAYDPWLRDRLARAAETSHYNHMNVLSMHALMGAYSDDGAVWLDALLGVLSKNAALACDVVEDRFEGVWAARPQGTYMLFLDCAQWCAAHGVSIEEVLRAGVRVGVLWQDGRMFGGEATIRMNLAQPTARVAEAFDRLDRYVFNA